MLTIVVAKYGSIGFYEYINNLILYIYWDILGNIDEYSDLKYRWDKIN